MIKPTQARLLREEKLYRLTKDKPWHWLRRGLFDKQLAAIDDPSKRKTIRCSRRAGKTHLLAAYALIAAGEAAKSFDRNDIIVPYIALTKGHARRLMWPILKKLDSDHNLGLKFNETELTATWEPSGAKVWLTGADRPAEIEKLRGGAYPLVIIDEAGSFSLRLTYLLDEVLDAALEDFDGALVMVGTPPASCAGAFYDADTGLTSGWSQHHWTVLDNPMFPRWAGDLNWREKAREWLDNKRATKSWDLDNPIYLREWRGCWIRDDSSLVYKYDADRNSYLDLPEDADLDRVLSIDLGFDDSSAWAVLAGGEKHGSAYLEHDEKKTGQVVTEIAHRTIALKEQYKPFKIVCDTGGLGKMIVEEINKRFSLGIIPAQKKDKKDHIELLNDDLRCGRFFVRPDSGFAAEASVLQWDEDKRHEDERFDNHICDAVLYGWRELRHFRYRDPTSPPPVGSKEHEDQRAAEQRRRAQHKASGNTRPWWETK